MCLPLNPIEPRSQWIPEADGWLIIITDFPVPLSCSSLRFNPFPCVHIPQRGMIFDISLYVLSLFLSCCNVISQSLILISLQLCHSQVSHRDRIIRIWLSSIEFEIAKYLISTDDRNARVCTFNVKIRHECEMRRIFYPRISNLHRYFTLVRFSR